MTAPVSAGSSSTRIASGIESISCSGRVMRSKNALSGRKASFTVRSASSPCSSACITGPWRRFANVSEGSKKTGTRLTVAVAAPESRFVDPGPIDAVHASVESRLQLRA